MPTTVAAVPAAAQEREAPLAPGDRPSEAEAPQQRREADKPTSSPERGAFVRVLVEASGEPVGDLELRAVGLKLPGEDSETPAFERQSVLTTDTDGLVDLDELIHGESNALGAVRLAPHKKPELELVPWSFAIDALGPTPDRALVVHVRERPTAPVRGVLLDKESGSPVADYALTLAYWLEPAGEEWLEDDKSTLLRQSTDLRKKPVPWVVTDAEGRFATKASLPAGKVSFASVDLRRTTGEHRLDAGGGAIEGEYSLAISPRILLDFDPPGDRRHGDFMAGLWRAPAELARNQGLQELASPWSGSHGAHSGYWGNAVAVQGGHRPWFRPAYYNLDEAPLPTRVFVMSRDGRAFGHAEIEEFERHAFEPLRVELELAQALEGVLVWPPGETMTRSVDLSLLTVGDEEESVYRGLSIQRAHEATETPFRFQFLRAGRYELEVRAGNIVPWEQRLDVPLVAPLRVQLERAKAPETHVITGRIVTRSGESLDGEDGRARLSRLAMSSRDGYRTPPDARLTWEDGAAEFRFEGVIEGRYRIYPRWDLGGFDIPGSRDYRELPASKDTPLELVVHDDVPTQAVEVRVIEPPAVGYVNISVQYEARGRSYFGMSFNEEGDVENGITVLEDGRRAAVKALGPLPSDTRFEFTLQMEGYTSPKLGHEVLAPPDERGVRVAEIVPEKGCSINVNVYEGENEHAERSLSGIVLAFDGVTADETGSDGYVYVEGKTLPRTLEVVTPGWKLVDRASFDDWGSVRAEDGIITIEDGNLTVHLMRLE